MVEQGLTPPWGTFENWHSDKQPLQNVVVSCGWGRLIFGQTFRDNQMLADALCDEHEGRRDIMLYLRDPHVVISLAPQEIFIDPSHTYRLWLSHYNVAQDPPAHFTIRPYNHDLDTDRIQEIYMQRQMIPPGHDFTYQQHDSEVMTFLVAEDNETKDLIGVVMGVDHYAAFRDPENGSSLWALAVDAQTVHSGVGEALVRGLAEHFITRKRAFMDLSVMHDNQRAIQLYERLGFERVIVFALKHKNPYNEPLFIAPAPEADLNPYAQIIIKEARRRGIGVEVIDEEKSIFVLSFGGRNIACRESLTELTSAVAMTICDDKALTRRMLSRVNLNVPDQQVAADEADNLAFLNKHQRIVIKPARGEQGVGIAVDVRTPELLREAIEKAYQVHETVLLEQFIEGQDLRIVVIDFKVAAAAIRKPAHVVGNGHDDIRTLIERHSRRRATATGGESQIPLDSETERCIKTAGYALDSVLAEGVELAVRKTANLHTGGTIYDVTDFLSFNLREAAVQAARALNIPVVGLDFLVPSITGKDYMIIEANERPGLANHEPQPLVERFIDLLFPQTVTR